jgi:hypothetical protein
MKPEKHRAARAPLEESSKSTPTEVSKLSAVKAHSCTCSLARAIAANVWRAHATRPTTPCCQMTGGLSEHTTLCQTPDRLCLYKGANIVCPPVRRRAAQPSLFRAELDIEGKPERLFLLQVFWPALRPTELVLFGILDCVAVEPLIGRL